jgi:ubiquinone/menaquinone biosynthesis methyltransferase
MTQTAPTAGAKDRAPEVQAMFDQLAPSYDRANRVLSLGLDQRWRRKAIAKLGDAGRGRVLDLCAGTLDLSQQLIEDGAESVVSIDFSAEMLAAGQAKLPQDAPIEVICADARELPLEDSSVDAIICGFGLRNVPELPRAIAECARVLRPGGVLVVLDFFQPKSWLSRMLQSTYNRFIMPFLGGLLTGYGEAYRYLASSIDAFQSRSEFESLLAAHGLEPGSKDMFPPVASMVWGVQTCD